jgi:hypothetical protein
MNHPTTACVVKSGTAHCGKEGDKLWIMGGKMFCLEQASQFFHEMNVGDY